jgi:hypothetical protein
MPVDPIRNSSGTVTTWLTRTYLVVIAVLFLGLIAYREYYRYFFPGEIDPVRQWLLIEHRIWSLISCGLLAVVALMLEWRGHRANGGSSLFTSFPGVALLGAIVTLFLYTAYGT